MVLFGKVAMLLIHVLCLAGVANVYAMGTSSKANIVFILIDDQGWGATSLLMDKRIPESRSDFIRTPNLERLADRGCVFSNAYAPHPTCSPSRCSYLTGMSPAKLGMTDNVGRRFQRLYKGNRMIPPNPLDAIPDSEITIAEWIKKHRPEYATAHFGKWHLAGGGPERHGFDVGDGSTNNQEGMGNPPQDPKRIFSMTKRALKWMNQQVKQGKPFYLQISHYATHPPIESTPKMMKRLKHRKPGVRHQSVNHAAMSEDLDESLGRILESIEEFGIADNTYIIYTSDNGSYPTESKGNINGPLHGWKATLWEGGIRVPFVVAGPRVASRKQIDVPIVGYDLFPTVCELLGIKKLPKGLEGGSFAEIVNTTAVTSSSVDRKHDMLVFHFPHYKHNKGAQPSTAVRYNNFKLHKFYETGDLHLYDLAKDVSETKNIAGELPDLVYKLHEMMKSYLREVNAGMPKKNPSFDPSLDPAKRFLAIKEKLMHTPYINIYATKSPVAKDPVFASPQ